MDQNDKIQTKTIEDVLVGIYDEEGNRKDDVYEIVKNSTGSKNVIKIRNIKTGRERLIHKDRTFLQEKRRETVDAKKEEVKNEVKKEAPKKKAKKKSLAKFDVGTLGEMGVIFKSKEKKAMEAGEQKITIESFCIVSEDATKWKWFNLYNHSLGKKGKSPSFGDKDVVRAEMSGNLEAIEKYLAKKGYAKIVKKD